MIARLARRLLTLPAAVPGYMAAIRGLRAREVAVVMYHGVAHQSPAVDNWCQLEATEFTRQIEYLAAHYRVLPLHDVANRLSAGRALPPRTACVTFDDGFRTVATNAFPILKRLQVPATVFLVTGAVGTGRPAWPDVLYHCVAHTSREAVQFLGIEYPLGTADRRAASYAALAEVLKRLDADVREAQFTALTDTLGQVEIPPDALVAPLDWEEVDRLARTGLLAFGSHTHTHPILSRCTPQAQRWELETSRDALRAHGLTAELFAYPNGTRVDFDDRTKNLLRELGYRCAVTTIPGLNRSDRDLYALRRVNVGSQTRGMKFALRMVDL